MNRRYALIWLLALATTVFAQSTTETPNQRLRQLENYLQEQGLIKMTDHKPNASKTKKRHNRGGQLTTPPKQAVIDSIRTVFTDLSKEARESHQYEKHFNGNDTLEYALVFSDTEAVNFTYKKNDANQARNEERFKLILDAMQDKKFPITGRNPQSSGASVKVDAVPCDFILVAACNMQDLQNILSPLRSRIIGNGYEVLVDTTMPYTSHNRAKYAQFVAQEIAMDGHIPDASIGAVEEIIAEGKRRAAKDGKQNALTLRLRELGGLIRAAGDIAVMEKTDLITADQVKRALARSKPIEDQIKERYGSFQQGIKSDISEAQKQQSSDYYFQNESVDDSMFQ